MPRTHAGARSETYRAASRWADATMHPFVEALASDALPADTFAAYMAQDAVFVHALADAVGHLIARAPTLAAKRHLTNFLAAVLDGEDAFFASVLTQREAPDLAIHPITRAFSDLLRGSAAADGYGPGLATLLAGEWVYLTWGERVAAHPPKTPAYRHWTTLHSEPPFANFVHWLQTEVDGLVLSVAEETRARQNFIQAVAYEVAFFSQFWP